MTSSAVLAPIYMSEDGLSTTDSGWKAEQLPTNQELWINKDYATAQRFGPSSNWADSSVTFSRPALIATMCW